jgi:chloride channel protein, CIC family
MGRERRLILDSLMLGVVGALGAQLFTRLLHLCERFFLTWMAQYRPPGLPDEGGVLKQMIGPHGLWLVPVATTLGGLISGLLVYSLAPEAEGHGTDTAVRAFHRSGGFIRARVTPLKMVASAITIGSGGAAGREGPTALISAGIGSIYATLTRRPDEDRRLLVLIGMAAGLSAIFRSPIGTALFAIEVLYGGMEFEAGALVYTMLASVVAFVLNGLFVGWEPLFRIPAGMGMPGAAAYGWYVALGIASGLLGVLLPMVFYGLRDAFHRLPMPPHLKPALGGLGVGLLALALPQVLGGGYGWIQEAIDGRLAWRLLLALVFAKMLAFTLTVSSGGSGGVFAPSLYVGGMLGGLLAVLFHQPPAAFVVVGMAATFGAAARVPIATLLMVTEMTGGYQLLVPAGLAVTLSYSLQGALSRRLRYRSLYEAQVPDRSGSPPYRFSRIQELVRLLQEAGALPRAAAIGHGELRALLDSGVSIALPDDRVLTLRRLRTGGACDGHRVRSAWLEAAGDEVPIIAILRDSRLLVPHLDAVLRGGDRLLIAASRPALERLAGELEPTAAV